MNEPFRFTRAMVAWSISAVVIGLVAAAMMIPVGTPSGQSDVATSAATPKPAAAAAKTAVPSRASAARTVTPKSRSTYAKKTTVPESPEGPFVETPTPVTITGCLELDDDTFRLKATSGADAPKARSWKTGFLRKRPATVEVVDAANGPALSDHVGQRVSVTGVLMDREMQMHSLQLVASSCEKTPVQVGSDARAKTSS